MLSILKKNMLVAAVAIAGLLVLSSCNKEFEDIPAAPPATKPPSGPTLNDVINNDTSYSFLKAAVTKAGFAGTLGNAALNLTLFAPDNNAFRVSGIPSAIVITALLDTATVQGLVSYMISPQKLTPDQLPTAFPNLQYPTFLNPAPGISPFLRLTTFPSKNANGAYVNNIPIIGTNTTASNGIIYKVPVLVAPPTRSIYDIINADTSLTFFMAALVRADSGTTSIADGSLTAAFKSIGANLTLFAPVNQAVKNFLASLHLPPSPAVFNAIPVSTVRGLVVYHVLGVRAYSVNMPATPTFIPTLLNTVVTSHPGVNVQATFTGPVVAALKITGVGNKAISANVIVKDINATNGVIHKTDMVLLPQ